MTPETLTPMPAAITLTKRICAATDGYQFLTSGFPNRSRDKKTFHSVDGLFVRRPLLPDLRPTESDIQGDTRGRQGIQVALTLRRTYRPGHRKMWVFGFRSPSRCLTQYKPRQVTPTDGGCTALVKLGTLYLDEWTTRDYFPTSPPAQSSPCGSRWRGLVTKTITITKRKRYERSNIQYRQNEGRSESARTCRTHG